MPSALPIYRGSDIEIKSEQVSGLIIAGESTTRFYLDTRDGNNMKTEPTMSELIPVFEIKSLSVIGDEDAEEMESAIIQNQNYVTYWMNFDTILDLLPLLIWLVGILVTPAALIMMLKDDTIPTNLSESQEIEGNTNIGLLQRISEKKD